MVAAATSGGLPFASRRSMTRSIAVNVSAYRARARGSAAAIAAAASRVTLSAAPLLMVAGSTRTTRNGQPGVLVDGRGYGGDVAGLGDVEDDRGYLTALARGGPGQPVTIGRLADAGVDVLAGPG